jgi:hypothetical protein
MTSKEIALKTIEQLPESASWEDIQERIVEIVRIWHAARGIPGLEETD